MKRKPDYLEVEAGDRVCDHRYKPSIWGDALDDTNITITGSIEYNGIDE